MKVEQQIEYEARSDAEAIQVARDRLGREAVILSSRPVKVGGMLGFFRRNALWVTAGILVPDKEDNQRESRERMVAFQHLLEVRKAVGGAVPPEQAASRVREPGVSSAFAAPASAQPRAAVQAYELNRAPLASAPVVAAAPAAQSSTREVDEIKEILGKVLSRLENGASAPAVQAPPAQSEDENLKKLVLADVDRNIAASVVSEYAKTGARESFRNWLPSVVKTMGVDPAGAIGGQKILFAGPTGVGKTTTIAKIAASQSLWSDRRVVLMTADTYRIAAVEQLRTYAKILGIPIEITADPRDIQSALKKHREADLILMDTAGRSHYDDGRIGELRALYESYAPDAVHLVMAANIKYRDMLNVIDRMGVVPLSALLFTKLDETFSYGTIFNVMRDFGLPASFFTAGQNVPNDIEVASGGRFVELLFKETPTRKE
ncbi:MAG: flagellar biosynthesis protein FlhF [Synergistaceae bacterium]|nr:flagellar biosynthesis protein FlhF [Synergistaceae bacterium]